MEAEGAGGWLLLAQSTQPSRDVMVREGGVVRKDEAGSIDQANQVTMGGKGRGGQRKRLASRRQREEGEKGHTHSRAGGHDKQSGQHTAHEAAAGNIHVCWGGRISAENARPTKLNTHCSQPIVSSARGVHIPLPVIQCRDSEICDDARHRRG